MRRSLTLGLDLPTVSPEMAQTHSDPSEPVAGADGPQPVWEAIITQSRPFLIRVSESLAAQVDLFEPEIAGYARYAMNNQGKQIRPALVALAGGAVGPVSEELVSLAVIIEMVHLATLVHDDIMDEAAIRRRRPTLAARWGNEIAVLLGDCLFTHALKLASSFPTPEICRRVATASSTVCTGEILQNQLRRNWKVRRADYFRVIGMKTAELFALSCSLAAYQSGGGTAAEMILHEYGFALGTAYQIYDDCLDLYGAEKEAGKSLGTDLASGKVTLPLLHFFEQATEAERTQTILWLENWQPSHFANVRAMLEKHTALAESSRVIGDFLNTARNALSKLKPGPEVDALKRLTEFLAQQTSALGV